MNDSNGHNESVTVGAGGLWAKLKGREPFLRVLILASMVGVGWLVQFGLAKWGDPFDLKQAFQAQSHLYMLESEQRRVEHDRFNESIRAHTYIFWLCSPQNRSVELQKKCAELDLQMPPSLRNMMKDRGQ